MLGRHLRVAAGVAALFAALAGAGVARGASDVVISQVYGGGGNSGAPYQNDYVELFNGSTLPVSLSGWSIQYTSATGTGNFGSATNLITPLSGTMAPGQYLLVQEASTAAVGAPLPTPDVIDSTPINMAATAGKVALTRTTTSLGCNGGSTPCGPSALALIVDRIGYGNANFFEGATAAPTLTNTTAAFRAQQGCQDTDNNGADFAAAPPSPRNTAALPHDCLGDTPPSVSGTDPAGGATGVAVDANVVITFNEPVDVSAGWYSIGCGTSGSHTATVSGGPQVFTLDPGASFANGEPCNVTVFASGVSDQDVVDPPDHPTSDYSFSFTTETTAVRIHDIQGASHISPFAGQTVSNVVGIVTAKRTNGFYMQDPSPDADDATSEGIFVFTSSAPTVNVGDSVKVSGTASEFRPGGSSSSNLTTTEISGSPRVTVVSSGNPLPAPVVIGTGGRIPPSETIEDDATGDVETSGTFDPASDGLDFYESVEGMRVELDNPVAVGPTNTFGETPVVGDDGANASVRTARGGLLLRPDDPNPERVVADDVIVPLPTVNVGDHYSGPLVGVLDYNFGNFFLEVTSSVTAVPGGLQRETTTAAGTSQVSIATFNVQNLDPTDPPDKFSRLASLIVNNLKSPDLISVEEVQDNNGATNDGTVDPSQTLATLISAIQSAGGPTYDYRQINPVNDQDGGEPGGNIRPVFLFRTDRGLQFVDRPGGGSTTATTVVNGPDGPELSSSPGRIDPTNPAWDSSRKPLAGEFLFNGHHLFVIANHFNSKGGDQPLSGHFQPPIRSSEVQRHQQAQLVHDFVASILAADPGASIVVDGDLNDFEFSDTVSILKGTVLHDLIETLPQNERYSYVFEGNSQVLDHILVSDGLFARPFDFDAVHVNAEFADQASDHDPSVVRITLNAPPTVDAGGPYAVDEGGSVGLSASGHDPEGGPLTYDWDLDGDGTFETAGQSPTFSAATLDGPSTQTVRVRVTDDGGLTATDAATITVRNVAPTATFSAPGSDRAGFPFTLSLTNPRDPSSADTAAGFTYAFDCGDGSGYGPFSSATSASCPTGDVGDRAVGGKIRDKDGGLTEYRGTVHVAVTLASLCELTRQFSADPKVADKLCDELEKAEKAGEKRKPKPEQEHLRKYEQEVGKQAGKGVFTAGQAATLIRLAQAL